MGYALGQKTTAGKSYRLRTVMAVFQSRRVKVVYGIKYGANVRYRKPIVARGNAIVDIEASMGLDAILIGGEKRS